MIDSAKTAVQIGVTLWLAWALAGCGPSPDRPVSHNPIPGSTALPVSLTAESPPTLPDQVEELYGTALFRDAEDLDGLISGPHPTGAYFILVSATDPGLGVLVYAGPASTPQGLGEAPSRPVKISGPVRVLGDRRLAQKVWQRHRIKLCTERGYVQFVQPGVVSPPLQPWHQEGTNTWPVFPSTTEPACVNFGFCGAAVA